MDLRHRAPRSVSTHMSARLNSGSVIPFGLPSLVRMTSLKQRLFRAENDGAVPMKHHLTKRHVAMAGFSLALLAVLCFSPSLFGNRVNSAIDGLGPRIQGSSGLPASHSRARASAVRLPGARRSARAARRCPSSTHPPATRSAAASMPSHRPTSGLPCASHCSAGSPTVAAGPSAAPRQRSASPGSSGSAR